MGWVLPVWDRKGSRKGQQGCVNIVMARQKEKVVCKTGELCKFDCPQVGFYHPRSNLSQSVVHSVVVFGRLEGQGKNGLILNNFIVIIFQLCSCEIKTFRRLWLYSGNIFFLNVIKTLKLKI